MLGRNGFPKAGDGGLKLEVTAQALVRHAPVEDQHGDMTFFASQHEAGPEFGFQQADHTRADLIERLLHEFWRVQREKRRTDGQPRVLLMKFSRHILQNVEPLPCPRGGEHIQRFRSAPLFAQYGKMGEPVPRRDRLRRRMPLEARCPLLYGGLRLRRPFPFPASGRAIRQEPDAAGSLLEGAYDGTGLDGPPAMPNRMRRSTGRGARCVSL